MRSLRDLRFPDWSVPLIFVGVTVAAYGLFSWQQGFHWDDWGFAWMVAQFEPERLHRYYDAARPFMAYLYTLTTTILGSNSFAWQIFAMFWHWAAGWALWWVLRSVWPRQRAVIFWACLFFLTYPGFQQQRIAIIYGHFFLLETLFLVSVGLMLSAAKGGRWRGLGLAAALIFSAVHLFLVEYFFGLDLLRPVLLWIVLRADIPVVRQRIKAVLAYYAPFALVLVSYLYWRVFVFKFPTYQPRLLTGMQNSPLDMLIRLPAKLVDQWFQVSLNAWGQIFRIQDTAEFGIRLMLVYSFVLVGVFLGLIYYFWRMKSCGETEPLSGKRLLIEWFGVGLLATLLAGIPFLVTGLQVYMYFPNDRFALPFALGVGMLLSGLLALLRRQNVRVVFASLLVALAVGFHIQVGFDYRADWNRMKSLFWQMSWRAPDIQPDTLLLSQDSPFEFSSDNSVAAPLNWTYAPDNHSTSMSYMHFDISVRLGNSLQALEPGIPIEKDYLPAVFNGSTDQILVFHYAPPACLHILHPLYDKYLPVESLTMPESQDWELLGTSVLPRLTYEALQFSRPELILPASSHAASPPGSVFGSEPAHTWCYYFEKADLARQTGDWPTVARLGDEAFAASYHPDDASEYLPFIEAYVQTGRWKEARNLTRETAELAPILQPALCAIWQRVDDTTDLPAERLDFIETVKQELRYCPYP